METSRAERVLRDTVIPAVVGATAWSRAGEIEGAAGVLCAAIYVGAVPRPARVAAVAIPLRVLVLVLEARVGGREPAVRRDHPATQLADQLLQGHREVGDVARSGELRRRVTQLCGG
jgi:hypothetical protein